MKVICGLCDTKKELDDRSLIAKRLRNQPITIYLCDTCRLNIEEKSLKRLNNLDKDI